MPISPISDATASVAGVAEAFQQTFGVPSPPPAPPSSPPTVRSAPIVSSSPTPGQGIALDASGQLSVVVSFLGVVTADPASPRIGQFWYRQDTSQLCVRHNATTTKRSAAYT